MLSRLSPRCTRLSGQGSLFHQCTRRNLPKETHIAATQRAFTATNYHRSYESDLLVHGQDGLLAKHWNRVAKLSHKKSLHSKREIEYQMSIIQHLQAEKELLLERSLRSLWKMGPTPAWLLRISNIYKDIYVTGDRLLTYARSGRILPHYIQYTPKTSAWARSCRWKVPLMLSLAPICLLVVASSAVWLSAQILSGLRRIGRAFERHAASKSRDLEHKLRDAALNADKELSLGNRRPS